MSDLVTATKPVLLTLVGCCGTVPLSARSLPGSPCYARHPAPFPLWSSLPLLLMDTKAAELQVVKIFSPEEWMTHYHILGSVMKHNLKWNYLKIVSNWSFRVLFGIWEAFNSLSDLCAKKATSYVALVYRGKFSYYVLNCEFKPTLLHQYSSLLM